MAEAATISDPLAGFDVEAIRAQFPILSREIHGKPLIYLDNGASAQKPRAVIDAMSHMYETSYANVHRGLHTLSNEATDAFEQARETVRRFLNAGNVDDIVFTRNATEGINLVSYSHGMVEFEEGDEIVLSIMEHHANIVPWHFLRERKGVKLVWVPVRDDGSLHLEDVEAAITDRTRLIAMTHMSNVLGTVTPMVDICSMARERGIATLVDGSQSAVHMPVDVQALGCDWFVFTGHKAYGPTGVGVLYGRPERMNAMRPFLGGGEMIEEVTTETVTYNQPPHRFEAGTPNIVEVVGLAAALDWMDGIGRDTIAAHEAQLRNYAHERLGGLNWLRIFGHAPDKGAIVSFEMEGVHAHDVSMLIDRSGIAVRAGTHCAQPLLQHFGVTSTCRASFAVYNTLDEVDRLAEALQKAHDFFG
ncbi:cysteine desulfurase [Notoacmeibacter marinus]|uniref:cysteine desulfurase n=1 Tax=Notoacmeibacter marinus TaxID=1876515 RepID=UPI000DF3EE4B|nr:cysteine desulfurase [Notoacmeibacter marinus]